MTFALPTADKPWAICQADAIEWLDALPPDSLDLIVGSPPYMDARTYGIDAVRGCEEWVEWMLQVTTAAVRVSKGLVLWVAAGVQRDLCYWPGCEGLMWEWWKRGNQLWRPCIWHKVDANGGGTGFPGSGGKQWFRNDWEYVLAFKRAGWLPWADNTAMGHPPVYSQVGGEMSNRTADGQRINERVGLDPWDKRGRGNNLGGRHANGSVKKGTNRRASGRRREKMDVTAGHDKDGVTGRADGRPMLKIANPGNFLAEPMEPGVVVRGRVGGGHMGHDLCHENEAPYPVKVPEFFIRSLCPPGGIVGDCFLGSGTTAQAALEAGRLFAGCDLRASQVELTTRRLSSGIAPDLFNAEGQ